MNSKEIYRHDIKTKNTISLVAEHSYDPPEIYMEHEITDHVVIKVEENGVMLKQIPMTLDELEGIYMAAKAAQEKRKNKSS